MEDKRGRFTALQHLFLARATDGKQISNVRRAEVMTQLFIEGLGRWGDRAQIGEIIIPDVLMTDGQRCDSEND